MGKKKLLPRFSPKRDKKFRSKAASFLIHPGCAAVAWGVLTFELAALSVLSSDLRNWDSYPDLGAVINGNWASRALLSTWGIWAALALTVVVIVVQRGLVSSREIAAQNKMHDGIEKLEELNRTLPPVKFAVEVGSKFGYLDQLVRDVLSADDVSDEYLQPIIRLILDRMTGLAKTFDEKQDAHYSANLMIYRPIDKIADQDKCIKHCVRFWRESTLDNCSGILFMDRNLSTSDADKGKGEPDSNFTSNLALPVYRVQDKSELDFRHLLPGAPRAYFTKKMIVMHSAEQLVHECKQREFVDILQRTVNEISEYLDRTGIRSFISLPVLKIEAPTSNDKVESDSGKKVEEQSGAGSEQVRGMQSVCIGVVNIHKFEEGILRSDRTLGDKSMQNQSHTQFYSLLTPYLCLLTPLIERLTQDCQFTCRNDEE